MTAEQIKLVQESWAKASASKERTAGLFYSRLLSTDPAISQLFRGADMNQQGLKFMHMLETAVRHLDRVQPVEPGHAVDDVFDTLGRQHTGVGVKTEHYQAFGDALVWALKRVLGPEFTAAHEEAWWAVYNQVAGIMRQGAHPGEPPRR